VLQSVTFGRLPAIIDVALPIQRRLLTLNPAAGIMHSARSALRAWLKQLRVHQYLKNALVLVPAITAHKLTYETLSVSVLALICFSLSASAVYILNDLSDLEADRAHPTKRRRPLAAGQIKPVSAALATPFLLAASGIIALHISTGFLIVVSSYVLMTTAYTFFIKKKLFADVVLLGMLYMVRVIGGAVAISVPVSEWLLYFSMFVFTSLALVKRLVELHTYSEQGKHSAPSRGYYINDIGPITALAAACAMNGVTIFLLYVSSTSVRSLYANPTTLYLVCPILIFWFGRIILLAGRHVLHDDPLVFAAKDWVSWTAALATAAILLLASIPLNSSVSALLMHR
jgi:4-hydroxybenzoate polyprenyltransferase